MIAPQADALYTQDELGCFLLRDAGKGLEPTGTGSLDGRSVAVKDLINVAGWPTTNGASESPDEPAALDAVVVADLRQRGGRIIGKTALNEYAYGVTGYNPHHGWIRNPRDRSRTASGSSGGSAAAVAAGLADIGVGTDTSGSIRIPAACCEVFGFKAAHGAFAMDGVTPLAPSLDSMGFFTRDVASLAAVLEPVLDGLPPYESVDLDDIAIGEIGVDLEVPDLPLEQWTIFRHEVWQIHGERFTRNPGHYGKDVQRNLRLPIGDVIQAQETMSRWRERYALATSEADVVVGPVLDGLAPTIEAVRRDYERDESLIRRRLLRHTPQANALGWAALAYPSADGPVQVMAPEGCEELLLAVAASGRRLNRTL